ncbi:hypothetical protein BGZ99_004447 [Dissophora globulifera]|uniref:FAD-binding domain-containing protein n=1 Tax=Dissophora globulifera TaxID=979702 RepID=A0A9P6UZX0_9FUNG|nr:hypothetical protein BGZ99_004447 [Dissophora globulifera]
MTATTSAGSSGASTKAASSSSSPSHSTTSTVPVLITGAGPTGLLEAYLLTKMGIQVRIIDRALAPSPLSKAVVIHPRSLEIIQMSGLVDRFLGLGRPMMGFRFLVGTKKVAAMHYLMGGSRSHYKSGILLEQARSCKILTEELDKMGVQVDRGWELLDTRVVEEGEHTFVETTLRRALSGENTTVDDTKVIGDVELLAEHIDKDYETQVVRSKYLVAADGARSIVRHKLNIGFPGHTRSHKTIVWDGTYESDIDMSDITFIYGVNKKPMFSVPLPGGTRLITAEAGELEPDEDISTTLQNLSVDKFEKLINEYVAPGKLKITETRSMSIYRVNERRAEHFVHKNRIFLAGDSAHVQSPSGGQGMNTGLQDAHNLAWKLAFVINKIAPEALLETYQEREAMADRASAIAMKLLDRERDMGFFAMIKNRIFFALLPIVIPLMQAFGFEDESTMVDARYQENALCKAHLTQVTPAAQFQVGVRAEDGSLRPLLAEIDWKQDSVPTRLHELMAGIGCFHILVFVSDMLHLRTGTADTTVIQGVRTTTAKELERNIDDYLSIWRSKWSYASSMHDSRNNKDLFKVHVIDGSEVLHDIKESADGNSYSYSDRIKFLAEKRMGDGRIYIDDTKVLHKRYGITSSGGAGGIVVIRPDSYIGYRVNGAGDQAWKDVQDYFNSILTNEAHRGYEGNADAM